MRGFVILLALADVVLAIYLALVIFHRPEAPSASAAPVVETIHPPSQGDTRMVKQEPRLKQDSPSVRKLNWELLALADLHGCVANLREVGCPEATIQDIIVAEVNRRFAPRERALKLRYEDYELWESPSPGAKNALESQMQLSALYNEKKSLLKELLGVDIDIPMPKSLDRSLAQLDAALAELPEAKRAHVKSIQQGYQDEIQKLRARTVNFLEPADIDALAKLKADRRKSLAQALTPEELLEFDMKTSSLTGLLRSSLGPAGEVSDAEFRQAFKLMQGKYDAVAAALETTDQASLISTLSRLQIDMRTGEGLKEVLGEQRLAELKQARDPNYRRLKQAATEAGLPPGVLEKAYALQQGARAEFTSQMQNPNLSAEERMQASRQYTQKMAELRNVLGEEGYQKYMGPNRASPITTRPLAPAPPIRAQSFE